MAARPQPLAAWLSQFTAATSAGLAGFILLPTMPPWLASLHGHLDEVQGVATRGWRLLDLDIAETLIDKGRAEVNLVAAFPSLHAAYPALIAAFFWPQLGRLGRVALMAYPLAMAMTLVISSDHYMIDVIGGWAVVSAVVTGANYSDYRNVNARSQSAAGSKGSPSQTLRARQTRQRTVQQR